MVTKFDFRCARGWEKCESCGTVFKTTHNYLMGDQVLSSECKETMKDPSSVAISVGFGCQEQGDCDHYLCMRCQQTLVNDATTSLTDDDEFTFLCPIAGCGTEYTVEQEVLLSLLRDILTEREKN
jgi:hypothetical protein